MKFVPQFKERIWGGDKLRTILNKKVPPQIVKCGESWEISAVQDNVSEVNNGYLAGNTLEELIKLDQNVKSIVSSSYSRDQVMAYYKKYGFCDVMAKPYDIKTVSDVMHRVLPPKE